MWVNFFLRLAVGHTAAANFQPIWKPIFGPFGGQFLAHLAANFRPIWRWRLIFGTYSGRFSIHSLWRQILKKLNYLGQFQLFNLTSLFN
jgi:hypothetical protein